MHRNGRIVSKRFIVSMRELIWRTLMVKKLIGQVAVSVIVCTLAAIGGIAMMEFAGSKIKE